jgi:hypothetical protein
LTANEAEEAIKLAVEAGDALTGKPRWLQGGVVATLAAAWIVACSKGNAEAEARMLEAHLECVRKLLPSFKERAN